MKYSIMVLFVIGIMLIAGCTQQTQITQNQKPAAQNESKPTEPTIQNESTTLAAAKADFNATITVTGQTATLKLVPNYKIVAPGENKEGEGHFHLFLDDGNYIPLASDEYVFTNLSSGEHRIRITANNNDHTEKNVVKTFTFSISINITENATVTTNTTIIANTTPIPPVPPSPPIKEFTIEVDDSGFYPSSITVKKGDVVRINFLMRTTNVYFNGDRVEGGPISTGAILPGTTKTVEFTADSSFTFTSYWPNTNVRKADGQVTVQ